MLVRYYGHVGQPTGYGRAANEMCMALLTAGVHLELRPLTAPGVPGVHLAYLPPALAPCLRRDAELAPEPDVCIVHTIPMDCEKVYEIVTDRGRDPAFQGYLSGHMPRWIAYTTWESTARPVELRASLQVFDQVWHPCHANIDAVHGRQPAKVMPHAYDPQRIASLKAAIGEFEQADEPFRFYYIGDIASPRKNVAMLVRAFQTAFGTEARGDVYLAIHASGATDATALDLLPGATSGATCYPDRVRGFGRGCVQITTDAVPEYIVLGMHLTNQCYVTASRGEAWNLPAFDAMLAGRHLITPILHGSDDYLDNTSSSLVSSTKGPIWREPNEGELVALMRRVFEERRSRLEVGYDPAERYGHLPVGTLAKSYIEELLK